MTLTVRDALTREVAIVVDRIRQLGLKVVLHKMKYLGLVLDSRWNFVEHMRL